MEREQLEDLVSYGDALAAIKTLYGHDATLLEFTVKPATSSVQGFLSLILRVHAEVKTVKPPHVIKTSFIVKRLPVMQEHLELIEGSDLFDREIAFFNQILPMLHSKNDDLRVVKCIAAYSDTIILEDLCVSGYKTIATTMAEVGHSMTIAHVRLAIRKVAELHAASLDVDWPQQFPFLTSDALFEGHGRKMMEPMVEMACKAIVEIQKQIYPHLDPKYSQWLLSSKCYETFVSYVKPSSKYLNVLGHGDFWENNMMYKVHPDTKKPLDVKFIDLQIIRYAPATCDFFYLLYLCSDKTFRDKYLNEIIDTYVSSFNSAVCDTPDRVSVTSLTQEYQERKLFGALLEATWKPMILMESVFPGDNEEMTKEQLEQVMYGVEPDTVLQHFNDNTSFNSAMREIIDELIQEMDRAQVCDI